MIKTFSEWLADSALTHLFAVTSWLVPTVQTIHILSLAVFVTALVMLDFRLLGLTRRGLPLAQMSGNLLPWAWRALALLLVTGIMLIVAEPGRELLSTPFRIKMLLVLSVALLTYVFQAAIARDEGYWSASESRKRLGGAIGATSLILCVSIVAAGRLIAYVEHG
jgi:hypothetical protein